MKQNLLKTLKFISFFLLGILIFWYVYRKQDFNQIKGRLTTDVNYFWIFVSLFLGLLSHISRTIRWKLMIESLGYKPKILNTFLAVMIGYLMNLVLPRMGEISRCGVLTRYEKISFTKLIGTVVLERLIDVLMLLILLLIVIFTQFRQILEFLKNNPGVQENLEKVIYSPLLIIGLCVIFAILLIFRNKILQSALVKKLMGFIHQFGEGLRSIRKMKKKGAFIFHSLFIWFLYYLMLYCVFFSFGFTSHLSPLAGLTVFVFGSFGMVAPVQGGIGPWHFMVIEGLALYGVQRIDGQLFALIAHTSTMIMLLVFGLIALLVLPFVNERSGKEVSDQEQLQ